MNNIFKRITHAAAGVDCETIAKCSSAENSKYSTLGTLVYIPIVTGVAAMALASSYFTHNPLLAIAACLVWAGVVFVIERALISGLRPHKWSWAIPVRFILAVAMSCIITELLMIFLFKADINEKVVEKNSIKAEQAYVEGNARVDELKAQLIIQKQRLDEKEKIYHDEIDGKNGTGIHGYGPSSKAKEKALEEERKYFEETRLRIEEQIAAAEQKRDESVAALTQGGKIGLLQSIVALYELSAEELRLAIALWIVHLFFFCVELMPLFVKLSVQGNQYYDVQDMMDNQKVEAVRLTIDNSKKMAELESQCEASQQEMAIRNKMTRIKFQEASDKVLIEAKSLIEMAVTLDEMENKSKDSVSEKHAAKLKSELDKLFDEYINHSFNHNNDPKHPS